MEQLSPEEYKAQKDAWDEMRAHEKKVIREMIDRRKGHYLCPASEVSDEQAFGVIMSEFFEWYGHKCFQTMMYALEDSNEATRLLELQAFMQQNEYFKDSAYTLAEV